MSKTIGDAVREPDALEVVQRVETTDEPDKMLQALEQGRIDATLLSEQQADIVGRLKDAICSGKTTGDKARDFAIRVAGTRYAEVWKFYKDAGERILGHQSEFVLLVKHGHQRMRFGGPNDALSERDYANTMDWWVGVVSGELIFDIVQRTCSIPTQKHVLKNNLSGPWDIVANNIPYPMDAYPGFGSLRFLMGGFPPRDSYELHVGDKEVWEWFSSNGKRTHLCKVADIFDREDAIVALTMESRAKV